jgi:hypothetical protein
MTVGSLLIIIAMLVAYGNTRVRANDGPVASAKVARHARGARRSRARRRRGAAATVPSNAARHHPSPGDQPAQMAPQPEDVPPVKPPKKKPLPPADKRNP